MTYGVSASNLSINQDLYKNNNVSNPTKSAAPVDIAVFAANNNQNTQEKNDRSAVIESNQAILSEVSEKIPQQINEKLVMESMLKAMDGNDNLPQQGLSLNIQDKGINGGNITAEKPVFSSDGVSFELQCRDKWHLGAETLPCIARIPSSVKYNNKIKDKVKETALNYTVSKYLGKLSGLKQSGDNCVLEYVQRPLIGAVPVVTAIKTQDGYQITFDKQGMKTTFNFTNKEIDKAAENKQKEEPKTEKQDAKFDLNSDSSNNAKNTTSINLPKNLFEQTAA
jgi:hypothetical protein